MKALFTWNGRGLGMLLLAWAALICTADATSAIRDAQDVLARNVLRKCVLAVETIHLENPDHLQALRGKSCTEVPGLNMPGLKGRTFPQSLITMHPEAQEAFQVRVISPTGKAFVFPDEFTPLPAKSMFAEPGPRWRDWSMSLLCLGLLSALLARIPNRSWLSWTGAFLLLLGSSFLLTVSAHPPTEDGIAQAIILLFWNTWVWLLFSVTTGTLRRVVWAKTESWFQSLGAGLVWAALPSPVLTLYVLGTFHSLKDQSGFTSLFAGMLISAAVLLAILVGAHLFPWRRISLR